MAAPWSPPKNFSHDDDNEPTSGFRASAVMSCFAGLMVRHLVRGQAGFRMARYAQVLVDYVDFMEENGVHIDLLSMQNEAMHADGNYPSFELGHEHAAALREALWGLNDKLHVVVLDHNPDNANSGDNGGIKYVEYLRDQGALKPGDVVGWHLYNGDLGRVESLSTELKAMGIESMMTEITSSELDTEGRKHPDMIDPQGTIGWTKWQLEICKKAGLGAYLYFNLFMEPKEVDGSLSKHALNIRRDKYRAAPLWYTRKRQDGEDLGTYVLDGETRPCEYKLTEPWAVNNVFSEYR